MAIQEHPPEKIDIDRGPGRHPAYASLYRFGRRDGPAPLITYVGGAQTLDTYLARRGTHPEPVAACLRRALLDKPLPALDALLCPCPIDTEGEGYDGFFEHFSRDLLPRVGRTPAALGFVGHSAGAACAVHLAILTRARAAGVFGSTGVAERVHDLRMVLEKAAKEGWEGFPLVIMRNTGDGTIAPSELAERIPEPLHAVARKQLRGSHAFVDYARNETAAGAFLFVLQHLGR